MIVVVAALAMVATLPGRTHGLGMITERLLADDTFALNRISYSNLNLWATLLGGLFCLPCGWLIDRLGLRIMLTATVLALAMTVLWMTRLDEMASLSLAILLTRGFGQSALSVISITMVGKWFPGKLSLPMAVYSLLLSLGFASAAQLAKPWADNDWRVLWDGIGYLLLAFVPIALLLTRDPPGSRSKIHFPRLGWFPSLSLAGERDRLRAERRRQGEGARIADCEPTPAAPPHPDSSLSLQNLSLSPKGDEGLEHRSALKSIPDDRKSTDVGFTLSQALRTQTFWVFGLAISLVALIGSGLSLFNESVLNEQGFPTAMFYNLITLTGTVGLLTKLPVGWLGQRCRLNRLLAGGLVLKAICMALLPTIHSYLGIVLYGIGMGIAGTVTTVLFFTIWGQAFGRAHLGQIQSVAQMMTVLASAAGPRVFAECFDRYGNYNVAFLTLSALTALMAAWSWRIRVQRPEEAHTSQSTLIAAPTLQET